MLAGYLYTPEWIARGGLLVALLLAASVCSAADPAAAPYVTRIDSREVFEAVTIPEGFRDDLVRTGKYLAPASESPDLLQTVYQDVHVYPRHVEFMAQEFPERFPDLTPEEYQRLVERRVTRRYWAGSLYEIEAPGAECPFGFTVFTDRGRTAELLTMEEVATVEATLRDTFTLAKLCFVPDSDEAQERARSWVDPPFSIYFLEPDDDVVYEAYTTGTTIGRVRLLGADEAESLSATGALSWQDIVVLDGVPAFLESVVSGIVTGGRQGELSHLNVRAARRGTPNVFVRDAHEAFGPFEGQLVRIAFGTFAYETPEPVDGAEAEAWWAEHRPHLDPPAPPDLAWDAFTSLAEMTEERSVLMSRFGGKATNLALLNRCLPEPMRLPGFGIPYHYYDAFIENNRIVNRLVDPPRSVTIKTYINALLEHPSFRSDSEFRAEMLDDLRSTVRRASVDGPLVAALAERIRTIFGSPQIKVRFRSSSNMEDNLEFNGAGLYDSTSVCAMDSQDGDDSGFSWCDPSQDSERTIERGLRKVWASLWNSRAFEEREYFQLPHELSRMAILVSPAFPDEAANGVAFTGNPLDPTDKRYLINVQLGDESVVNPDPDVVPERDILEITDGEVSAIIRSRPSSLVPPGSFVLTDDQLRVLGSTLSDVSSCFTVDPGPFDPARVVLDLEFKFSAENALILKQVRPFLITDLPGPTPTFRLVIPEGRAFEGVHLFKRTLDQEQALLSAGRFRSGTFSLPASRTSARAELIDALWIGGPDRAAEPKGPGAFSLAVTGSGPETTYTFTYRQRFDVAGDLYDLTIENVRFLDQDGMRELAFDDWYVSHTGDFLGGLTMVAVPVADPENKDAWIFFSGAGYPALPLYQVEVEGGGDRIELDYRLQRVLEPSATGPANLVGARIDIREGSREVTDYWHLVYRADWHNILQRFRVLLDPPLGDVHAVDVYEPFGRSFPPRGFLRGADMRILRTMTIASYIDWSDRPFMRGDANADGRANVTDAVVILNLLFRESQSAPCNDALDVDDSGRIDISDAVTLLQFLFLNGPPPAAPFATCGKDPSGDDEIRCGAFPPCDA